MPGQNGVPQDLKGYPSVFMEKADGKLVEFDGKRTVDDLKSFLDKNL